MPPTISSSALVCEGYVVLPSSPDMIGAEFGRLIRPLIARAKEAAAEVHALSALRDALIPDLVSGQMRVRGNG